MFSRGLSFIGYLNEGLSELGADTLSLWVVLGSLLTSPVVLFFFLRDYLGFRYSCFNYIYKMYSYHDFSGAVKIQGLIQTILNKIQNRW